MATSKISAQKYPTLFIVVPVYNWLFDKLEDKLMEWGNRREMHSQVAGITAAIQKLKVYYAHTGAATYAAATGIFIPFEKNQILII